MKRLIILAICVFAAASCTKIIEFTGEQKQNLLVAYAELEDGQPLNLSLSCTAPSLGEASLNVPEGFERGICDTKAVVLAYIGSEKYTLLPYHDSIYLNDHCPKAGDQVRFEVAYPGFTTVTGSTSVPRQVEARLISSKLDLANNMREIKVRIHDKAGTDYYRIQVYDDIVGEQLFYYYDDHWNFIEAKLEPYHHKRSRWMVSNDPVFEKSGLDVISGIIGEGSDVSGYFTDAMFEGKDYDVTLTIPANPMDYEEDTTIPDERGEWYKCTPYIMVQAVSKDLFLYGASFWSYQYSGEDTFLSEPVQIVSNVKDGAGCIGAFSKKIFEL